MNLSLLQQTVLFRKMPLSEIQCILAQIQPRKKAFRKGDLIFHAGTPVQEMGLILSGRVNMERCDVWGNRAILGSSTVGETFAETYAILGNEPLLVDVVVAEPTEILFLNLQQFFQESGSLLSQYPQLLRNLLLANAQKNLTLSRRISHTTPKTIRGRLLSYLSEESLREGSHSFTIAYNRQQLADYLGVDRSALSNELSKMQQEGFLRVERNHFTLFTDPSHSLF